MKLTLSESAKKLEKKIARMLQSGLRTAMRDTMFRVGLEAVNIAQAKSPIKKGDLRGSITSNPKSDSVTFGSNKVYAKMHDVGAFIRPYTHNNLFGKRIQAKMKGRFQKKYKQGYLTPAFNTMKNGRALEILSEEIRSQFKK